VKPTPWARSDLRYVDSTGKTTAFIPFTREQIGAPLVALETTQRYVRQDLQDVIRKTSIQIPFLRPFENKLSLDPADYVSVGNGGTSYITKRVDGRHPAESLVLFFQSEYDVDRNRLWSHVNPLDGGAYYNGLKLLVASKDRETVWDSDVWQRIAPAIQAEKTCGGTISLLSFCVGPAFGYRAPERRVPTGTLNFTSADKPTLWMDIRDTLPAKSGQKRVTARAITTGWGLYIVENGRGTMVFGN
jgi:hypothetical protein